MAPPPPILSSRRLVIRTLAAKDIPALLAYLAAEARDHGRWTPRRPHENTAAHWRKALRDREKDRREGRSLFLYLFLEAKPIVARGGASPAPTGGIRMAGKAAGAGKATGVGKAAGAGNATGEGGVIVGHASLTNIVRGAFQACHLGYAMRKEHEGKGLMTEALRALLRHAFGPMGLHRVMANYMPSNRRSARVLKGLGFRREGLAREYLRIAGRWEDHVLTSLVNPRWRATDSPAAVPASPRRRRPKGR